MFREHGCELPCKRHVRAHEYAISISHPMHVLFSELRKPIEKSVCLAILFAPSLILRVGGKQLDIAAAKRWSAKSARPFSSQKLETCTVCSGRRRISTQNITATGSPSVAPLVLLHLPQWQSDQELVVGQNQK